MKKYILSCLLIFISLITSAIAKNATYNFLVISDIHLAADSTHVMEINPSGLAKENDLDPPTFSHLLDTLGKKIQAKALQPKFILILGDIVGHKRDSESSAIESENLVFKKLKEQFGDIPLLYVFGNNDSIDVNYGSFYSQEQDISPYKIAQKNGWKNGFLSTGQVCQNSNFPCLDKEDPESGYYSAYLQDKLKLIALNTVLFSSRRTGVTDDQIRKELDWLENQLKFAEEHQESVLIAMHIPPGTNVGDDSEFWVKTELKRFLSLIHRYHATIIATLASHTHLEEMKVIQDANHQLFGTIFLVPGLSTSHGNAPSAKTFTLKQENNQWYLSNYHTYHFINETELTRLYDFKSYYCSQSKTNHVNDCIDKVTAEKIQPYFSAGNPNFPGAFNFPKNIYIPLEEKS